MTLVFIDNGVNKDYVASVMMSIPSNYLSSVNRINFSSKKPFFISNPYGRGGQGFVRAAAHQDTGTINVYCGKYNNKTISLYVMARFVFHEIGHLNGCDTEAGADSFVRELVEEI